MVPLTESRRYPVGVAGGAEAPPAAPTVVAVLIGVVPSPIPITPAAARNTGQSGPSAIPPALVVCVGADEAEVARRAAAIGREPAELRQNGAAGTPAEVADTLRRWHAAGAERIYLQVLDLHDLDHLDLIAHEVAPLLA